jgi:hypothetical protein
VPPGDVAEKEAAMNSHGVAVVLINWPRTSFECLAGRMCS